MAFALLKLDPEFFRLLLLESFKRTGKRPDFVTAIPIFGVDGQIAGGDLQHGVAHVMQRFDDPAGNGEYGPGRQGNRCRGSTPREEIVIRRAGAGS